MEGASGSHGSLGARGALRSLGGAWMSRSRWQLIRIFHRSLSEASPYSRLLTLSPNSHLPVLIGSLPPLASPVPRDLLGQITPSRDIPPPRHPPPLQLRLPPPPPLDRESSGPRPVALPSYIHYFLFSAALSGVAAWHVRRAIDYRP